MEKRPKQHRDMDSHLEELADMTDPNLSPERLSHRPNAAALKTCTHTDTRTPRHTAIDVH